MLTKILSGQAISLRTNPALVVGAAVPLCGALVGAALVADTRLGIAMVLGLLFLPVALVNLQLALVLWLPLIFLEGLPAFNSAAKAGGLLISAAWVGASAGSWAPAAAVLRRHRPLLAGLAALLLWYSLSLLWAADRGEVLADLWHWYAVALLMLIVATTVSTRQGVRLICWAFVAGAVLSIAHGIVTGGLTTSSGALDTDSGRLEGGLGDPNFLAAGIVPAIVFAIVLFATTRRPAERWTAAGAVGLLTIGLAASESRGGLVAAVLCTAAAFVFFKRQRVWTLAFVTVVVGILAAWFSVSPTAWERISEIDNGGSGRDDLWTLGWRMFEENPLNGVGLNNFSSVAGDYTREAGSLDDLRLIFDHSAQVAHNAYVQALADTGAIGLGLFLAVILLSMRAAQLAARRFEAIGDRALGLLARGTVVATIGLLGASFFISNGVDKRLWVLFGLGPALLAIASRQSGAPPDRRAVSVAPAVAPRERGATSSA